MAVTTRQLVVTVAAVTLLVSALVWFFGAREAARFHLELREYLQKVEAFREWEGQGGGSSGSQ